MDVPDLDEMVVGAGEGETVGLVDGEYTLIRLMNTSGEIEPDCMSLRSRFCRIELSMLRVTTKKKAGNEAGRGVVGIRFARADSMR